MKLSVVVWIYFLLIVTPIISWGQASLPIDRTIWNGTNTTGWTHNGVTARTSSSACSGNNGGIFDSSSDWLQVQFDTDALSLTFQLKKQGMSGQSFMLVQGSNDGTNWTDLGKYGTATGATSITDCGEITIALDCGIRFVKWTYTKATGNCDIDDVIITERTTPCITASNTITATSLSSSTFNVPCGQDAAGTINFTSTDEFDASNIYTVQLSNEAGDFTSSPTIIGTFTSTANSGIIPFNIPTGTIEGSTYKIRIVSSSPAVISNELSPITISYTYPSTPIGTISVTQNCGQTILSASNPSANTFWQTSATGISTTFPTTSDYTLTSNGTIYIRTFDGLCWSNGTISQAGTIILAPTITSQPADQTVNVGATATFSATATNATSYQWELSTDNGITWSTIAGATTNSYTTAATTLAMNGYKYRVIVNGTNPCTPVISNVGTLTVQLGPCVDESFEINGTASGWTYNGAASSTNGSNTGNRSVRFNATNQTITSPLITNLSSFSFWYRRSGTSPGSPQFTVLISTDNLTWTQIGTTITTFNTTHQQVTFNLPTGGDYYVRILHMRTSGANEVYIDDFVANCQEISTCVPTHTFTSFSPANGSIGTEVTIIGSGFTTATSVTLNGITVPTTFVNATTIKVTILAGMQTGAFIITEDACDITTSNQFTFNSSSGICSTSSGIFNDLFISEVYDSDSNNGWYMELYNPTANAIDLGAEGYVIERYGTVGETTPSRTIALIGIIPPNSVFTINSGTTNSCSDITFDFIETGSGINEQDQIRLVKNGTVIDLVNCPNQTGYSLIRNENEPAPSTTYIANGWDINTSESCANIGIFDFVTNSTQPTILTHPASINACGATFTVEALAGNGGTLTYQWFYQDNNGGAWTAVSATNPTNLTIAGFNTSTLEINQGVASTATIDSFQFYCLVSEDASCSIYSNAVKFNFEAQRYYRSKITGMWNTALSWQTADSQAGPWSDACTYPTDQNSDYISIENGHTITLPINLSADQIIVQASGVLVLDEKLTVPNGNTIAQDLEVIGTLIDNGDATNGLNFSNGGTWLLGNQGTVIKTWSSSVLPYKENYEGGIATIPNTASWYYRYVGNDNVVTLTENMYYPNLYFESSNGFHAWDATNEFLNGTIGTATIKGNLHVGNSNNGTVEVYHNNTFASPILVIGNVYVGGNSTLRNTSLGGGSGTGFEIKGSEIFIDGLYQIDENTVGTTILSGSNLQLVKSTNNGVFNAAHVQLNNANGARIDAIDMNISQTLTFIDGILHTISTQTNKINLTNNAVNAIIDGAAQSTTNRYIDGKLQWLLAEGNAYTFPIGANKATYGAQGFKLTSTTGNGAVLAYLEPNASAPILDFAYCDLESHPGTGYVNAGNGNPGYDGILDQIFYNLHSDLHWNITNTSGAITNYDITVLATGNQDIYPVTTANNLPVRYLMKDGQPGNPMVSTVTPVVDFVEEGFDLCPNQYTLLNLTSFSLFTLDGASQGVTVLPIELVEFTGELINQNDGLLHWITASEINNDYFTLQHSTDGIDFQTIAQISGAGNSTTRLEYNHVHNGLRAGIHYYKLLSTDYDGTVTNRGIVALEVGLTATYFNNLTKTIEFSTSESVSIYSTDGKLVARNSETNSLPFHHKGMFLVYFEQSKRTEKIVIY